MKLLVVRASIMWAVTAVGTLFLPSSPVFAAWVLCPNDGVVVGQMKISSTSGGFSGTLDDFDRYGVAVCSLGDLDGDGVSDLAVGSHFDDDGDSNSGAVWILFLHADGTVKAHQKISQAHGDFSGELDEDDFFGISVANLGDLDSDGIVDIAVGAFRDDDGGTNRGAIWILFLNSDGTVKGRQKISAAAGNFAGQLQDVGEFGVSVEGIGDLRGDGTLAIAVGAHADAEGAVWMLFLNSDGTVANAHKIAQAAGGFTGHLAGGDSFGIGVCSLGDVNGDGVTDLAVGAFRDDDGGADTGAVWILMLDSDGLVSQAQKISRTSGAFEGAIGAGDNFGVDFAGPGDLDGDGVPDLIVGAHFDDDGGFDRGAIYLVLLNPNGTVKGEVKISQISGAFGGDLDDGDNFGEDIALVGDLDADGHVELAVGAFGDDDGGDDRGAVWLLSLGACTSPVIVSQPPCAVLLPAGGGVAQLSISVAGLGPFEFQWRRDGVALEELLGVSGSRTAMLSITADVFDVGVYDCVVTSPGGDAVSSECILAVRGCEGDANGDAISDFDDITAVLARFGLGCP